MMTIIRAADEDEKLWFYGGGVHTWKVNAKDTDGALCIFEDALARGKTTPLHRHPDADEIIVILEGEVLCHAEGEPQRVGKGGVIINQRGVVHAFVVTSDVARILTIVTPGTGMESFFKAASEPVSPTGDGPVDFRKVGEAAKQTGATEILGPPPFRKEMF